MITSLQDNLDKTRSVIDSIKKLDNTQEKFVLLLQCIPGRIQHLLAAVPMHLSRDFARHHGKAITEAVAKALGLDELNARDKLLLQRKISDHGLGLRSMEGNLDFFSFRVHAVSAIKRAFPTFHEVLNHTLEGESGLGRDLMDALEYLRGLPSQKLVNLLPATLDAAPIQTGPAPPITQPSVRNPQSNSERTSC